MINRLPNLGSNTQFTRSCGKCRILNHMGYSVNFSFFPVKGTIIIQRAFRIPCPESSLVLRVENSKLLFLSFGLTNSEISKVSIMICLVSFQSPKKPSYPNEKYRQSYFKGQSFVLVWLWQNHLDLYFHICFMIISFGFVLNIFIESVYFVVLCKKCCPPSSFFSKRI